VLEIAYAERRILITDDRDFGALVFLLGQPHAGVIYFRLGRDVPLAMRIERLDYALAHHADELDQFLVVSQDTLRVRRRKRSLP
jgi:predicted nuclease of predicted toxin-antitoxin system